MWRHMIEVVLSENKMQILTIPGQYLHGYVAISNKPVLLVYFVDVLYDYKNPGKVRKPYNEEIIPIAINGKFDDPRCGKPWRWR